MMQPIAPIVSGDKPRFRQDLVAEAVDEHGATFIDVMDPDSGNVFRFYEVEFSLACAMDGERDVPGLVRWAQDELGVAPSPVEVREVIATLGELGYLDHTAEARAAAADTGARPEDAVEEVVSDDRTIPVPPRAAAGDAVPSEVSLNLSDHVEVGPADVQEAVRQSRVMTAVEPPQHDEFEDSLAMPSEAFPVPVAPPPRAVERVEVKPAAPAPAPVKQPAPVPRRPEVAKHTEEPPRIVSRHELPTVEQPPLERPLELMLPDRLAAKAPERPVERPTALERPAQKQAAVIVDTPVPVATAKPAERPVERPAEGRKPVELPKEPPKIAEPIPVVPPAPERRVSPALIVVIVLLVLGVAAFLVWKYVLDQSNEVAATSAAGSADKVAMSAAPAPPVEEKPPTAASTIELSSGKPKTILAFFAGTIEWIAASDKEVKTNDIIMKLRGAKPIEAQVVALTKELEKRKQELDAAIKVRDAADNEAAKARATAKVTALEKLHNDKSEALTKKQDQLEPFLVRPPIDGKLTVTRKVGEQIPENTPIATVLSPPAPSATFKVPEGTAVEVGLQVAIKQGEKLLTCSVAESEPGAIRMTCPPESGATEGAAVTWELPRI